MNVVLGFLCRFQFILKSCRLFLLPILIIHIQIFLMLAPLNYKTISGHFQTQKYFVFHILHQLLQLLKVQSLLLSLISHYSQWFCLPDQTIIDIPSLFPYPHSSSQRQENLFSVLFCVPFQWRHYLTFTFYFNYSFCLFAQSF